MKTAEQILDLYYLDARCMLVELAAILDRHDRAESNSSGANGAANGQSGSARDGRKAQLDAAIQLLAKPNSSADRSEQLLNLFSDLD